MNLNRLSPLSIRLQHSIDYDSDLGAAYGLSSETCMLFTMLGRLGFIRYGPTVELENSLECKYNKSTYNTDIGPATKFGIRIRICLSETLLSEIISGQISAISKMFENSCKLFSHLFSNLDLNHDF